MSTAISERRRSAAEATGPFAGSVAAPRLLVALSLGYLVAPAGLQLAFWLRPELAAVAVASTVSLAAALRGLADGPTTGSGWRWPAFAAVGVTFVAGIGGVLSYSGDWRKHYALLRDLSTEPWPVVYDLGESVGVLDYTLGWYLPAAGVGRVGGWPAANVALGGWMALGLTLAIWWFAHLVGSNRAIPILLAFSGLDVVGALLLPALSPWAGPTGTTLETWSLEWQLPSVMRAVLEAPQHALATMLLAGLVLSATLARLPWSARLAVAAAAAMTSPFAVIAAVPFVLVDRARAELIGMRLRDRVGAGVFSVTVALFYLTRLAGPPDGIPNEVSSGVVFLSPRFPQIGSHLVTAFVLVVALEVLVLGAVLSRALPHDVASRRLVVVAMATMIACVSFRIGHNNDLAMRGIGMAVFVLAVLAARVLLAPNRARMGSASVAVVVLLGSVTALVEVHRNVFEPQRYDGYSPTEVDDTVGLLEMGERWYPERESLLSQYLVADRSPASVILADD